MQSNYYTISIIVIYFIFFFIYRVNSFSRLHPLEMRIFSTDLLSKDHIFSLISIELFDKILLLIVEIR